MLLKHNVLQPINFLENVMILLFHVAEKHPILYMYRIFFIHSSVDGV